jgi:DNA polymerase-4
MAGAINLCRDCDFIGAAEARCPRCDGTRLVTHPELTRFAIAHIDCDAFYASVEKRDRPELAAKPVIVGGGHRGVVAACCYIARLSGVKSAMPMFKALTLCPDAVVIRPDMAKYAAVSRQIRGLMVDLTPLVQPLSIDEAVLDLSGTEALHGAPPALVLTRFARMVECEAGVTVSIGLAPNRLLAKLAAERDKPRGFAVLGSDAPELLAAEPVTLLPGVGAALAKKLASHGIIRIGQLSALSPRQARIWLGDEGPDLVARANFIDVRLVDPVREAKSISAETTFAGDISNFDELARLLYPLCEKLGHRLKLAGFAAAGLTLKLKTSRFQLQTKAISLAFPTQVPETIWHAARETLRHAADGTKYRLIGIGAASLVPPDLADRGDLVDQDAPRRAARQNAIDALRDRYGSAIIRRGS